MWAENANLEIDVDWPFYQAWRAMTLTIYSLFSVVFGWWGIPYGPIYTVMALITNFGGGKDVTRDVRALLKQNGVKL